MVVEPISFRLEEITPEELALHRISGIPFFVLKTDGKFYYCSIPSNINVSSSFILGTHCCSGAKYDCMKMYAKSDEEGGCAKVRDRIPHIEKYDFITTGYEIYYPDERSTLTVIDCKHYKLDQPRPINLNSSKLKLGLAQNVWPYVSSREEVRKLVKANHKKVDDSTN